MGESEHYGTRDSQSRHSEHPNVQGWPCTCGHTSAVHEYDSREAIRGHQRCNAEGAPGFYCPCKRFTHSDGK